MFFQNLFSAITKESISITSTLKNNRYTLFFSILSTRFSYGFNFILPVVLA